MPSNLKRFLALALFLCPVYSWALHFSIVDHTIEGPEEYFLSSLMMEKSSEDINKVSLEIISKTGKAWKKIIPLQRCEFCSQKVTFLPLNLKRFSCSLKLRALSSQGTLIEEQQIPWGKCAQGWPNIDQRLIPDLTWNEESSLGIDGKVEVQNLGAPVSEKEVEALALVFNKEGQVIWTGKKSVIGNWASGEIHPLFLAPGFSPWQKALACRALLILDPAARVYDQNPMNNMREEDFGPCEEMPHADRGDLSDFIPMLELANGIVEFSIINQGKLPYDGGARTLNVDVEYRDALGKKIFERTMNIQQDLYGFGTQTSIMPFPRELNACEIHFTLNPQIIIQEIDYTNNQTSYNFCEN